MAHPTGVILGLEKACFPLKNNNFSWSEDLVDIGILGQEMLIFSFGK